MIKDRVQMESSDFNAEDNIDSGSTKEAIPIPSEVPRRSANSDSRGRYIIVPSRIALLLVCAPRRKVLGALNCEPSDNTKEARRKCMMMVRKHHPGKWCEGHTFNRENGECVFKGALSAHDIVIRR